MLAKLKYLWQDYWLTKAIRRYNDAYYWEQLGAHFEWRANLAWALADLCFALSGTKEL